MSRCVYCDIQLDEFEIKRIDPKTGEPRGCNTCWEMIEDTIKDYDKRVMNNLAFSIEELEVVSLNEVEIPYEKDEKEWET